MSVRRIVANLSSRSTAEAVEFYQGVLGLEVVMDHGWIATVADPDDRGLQLSVMSHDASAPVSPDVSIEVDDVDAVHAAALQQDAEIVHPLTDEPWGVRRFFLRDPDGHVINVLAHR
ncbi:MAG: VOC family protein [Aeromicrobium sp.]|uniref:VOC family protein n=1 Tax=Aeromicrobium sp. TaxID=1871063 RepID=UPI003C3EA9FA